MSIEPEVIRAESHPRVGRLVQHNVAAIIERWRQRAFAEQPRAGRVHEQALLDHLPELLEAIGLALVSGAATEPPERLAKKHGHQRWDAGWSLTEVVRDYQILRLVLLEFTEESLDRPLNCREWMAIGLVLDEAITASLQAYVAHRDAEVRLHEQERLNRESAFQARSQQALLEQAEALKASDRRKNEFLALLGHELRNPLGAMHNALELTRVLDPADADFREAWAILARQLKQMERLVDDLLDISRITRGVLELKREPVELAAAVRHADSAARPLAEARGHELLTLPPGENLWIDADPARLQQVLMNLLVNAIKYTPPGGQIRFSADTAGSQAVIRIADTGLGISPEMLPRIFDLFMQAQPGKAHCDGGLGIGLTLVRKLVELHGGQVSAASQGPNRGSEFEIRLDLAEAPAAQPPPDTRLPSTGPPRPVRILIVDDNADVGHALSALLRRAGHEVQLVHDGPSAIQATRGYRPQTVLIDIGLPGMDGYQLCRRLRDDVGLRDAVFVALTGFGQEEDRRRSHEAGFDLHLTKPVGMETLLALLSRRPGHAPSNEAANAAETG